MKKFTNNYINLETRVIVIEDICDENKNINNINIKRFNIYLNYSKDLRRF